MVYVLTVMAKDPSRVVRRQVAKNACQSLALLHTMGELKETVKKTKSLLVEEDGGSQDGKRETKKVEADNMFRALRKNEELGKNDVFRKHLMSIIMWVYLFYLQRFDFLTMLSGRRMLITKFAGVS